MREESNVRLFQPEHPKNPYIGTAWLGFIIIFVSKYIIQAIVEIDWVGINKLMTLLILTVPGMIWFVYLITLTFLLSEYIILTEDTVIGKNRWKKKKGEIRYDEIAAIYVKGKSYFIHVDDIHGNKIRISGLREYIEEVMNEIITKAINCKKIDIRYIKNRFPNISVYERGLQSE